MSQRRMRGRLSAAGDSLAAGAAVPLLRNGYALVISTVVSSALGLLYWLLAARLYEPEQLGVSAALLSAMIFLALIAQLDLDGAMTRFLPVAGRRTRTIAVHANLIGAALALVVGGAFVLVAGMWSGKLSILQTDPLLTAWFIISTVAWCIFVLQEGVLTGLRRATWIPVRQLAFGVFRVAFLLALVATAPTVGVFIAWTLPIIALVIWMEIVIARLIPRHVAESGNQATSVSVPQLARYVAGDYLAGVAMAGTIGLMPLLVLVLAGPAQSAYFFMPWTIAFALYLVTISLGRSLVAEGALASERLVVDAGRVLRHTARLVVPTALILVIVAPWILDLLRGDYSGEGTNLLRLLALSAIPFTIVQLATDLLRVRRRMRALVAVYVGLYGAILISSLVLISSVGIVGVGIAWLTCQAVAAVALGAGVFRPVLLTLAIRRPHSRVEVPLGGEGL